MNMNQYRQTGTEAELEEKNTQSLIRFALLFGIGVFFSSGAPDGLMAASLSSLLFIGSLASALVAILTGDKLFAEHFTRWDEAAGLMVLSTIAGWFVDPEALQVALQNVETVGG